MCSMQVKEESGQSCVVAGNSLGGFTALYAASSEAATAGAGATNLRYLCMSTSSNALHLVLLSAISTSL